jgi:hypothetical protein
MAERVRSFFVSINQLMGCENPGANFFSGHAETETAFPDLHQKLSHCSIERRLKALFTDTGDASTAVSISPIPTGIS